jgi:hypothetical protein
MTRSFGRTTTPEGVAWVEEEFVALYLLPDAIVEEIGRIARRVEVRVGELPAATSLQCDDLP